MVNGLSGATVNGVEVVAVVAVGPGVAVVVAVVAVGAGAAVDAGAAVGAVVGSEVTEASVDEVLRGCTRPLVLRKQHDDQDDEQSGD